MECDCWKTSAAEVGDTCPCCGGVWGDEDSDEDSDEDDE